MNSELTKEATLEHDASVSEPGLNIETHSLDPNCMVNLTRKLVRIQYPAIVKNVDKAIETLGGMETIERVVSNHKHMLDLRFHSENKYLKPCSGDKDYNAGILLKIKAKIPMKSSAGSSTEEPSYDYSVVGVTAQNITFNRLCDFQYLPLITKSQPETKDSEVENIYRKILPESIPNMEFFKSEESKNMPFYFTPASYGRFDSSNNRLYLETGERYESEYRPEIASSVSCKTKSDMKTIAKPFVKKHCFAHTINYVGGKVPEGPPAYLIQLMKDRYLTDEYQRVYKWFDERPIWTRAAIMFVTKMTFEHSKIVLPAMAYYIRRGPWRTTWVKFGYDPRSDPKSRCYQTLDYRIRTSEGSKKKIALKRKPLSRAVEYTGPMNLQNVSLTDEALQKNKGEVSESCFILTPNMLPPARQLFYQFCDLKLPEIEKMLARLPQPSPNTKCHPKNGWLPAKFTEQCREVVNNYILKTIKKQMLQDKEQVDESKVESEPRPSTSSEYCSRMLSNIRKGIYTTIPISTSVCHVRSGEDNRDTQNAEGNIFVVEDNEDVLETAQEHIERTIPERLDEDLLDEDDDDDDGGSSQGSDDLDIDMEALEEVNRLVGVPKKVDQNTIPNFSNLNLLD